MHLYYKPPAEVILWLKRQLRSVHLFQLVEAAGIEPASANPLPKDLHV